MSMQSITISGYKSGVQKNKKPFLLNDDAFSKLENAYVWREELRNREGLKLIGRFRRVLTSETSSETTPAADGFSIVDIISTLGISGESNSEIEPGSLVITIAAPDASTFTDQGDGTFAVTGLGVAAGSFVDYSTGNVTLEFTGVLTGGAAITVNVNYFPGLPAMGIWERDIAGINDEQTIWFDTKYAYIHDGADFQEFPSTQAVTWAGTDADFFWSTNYRGATADVRLFFTTNFVDAAGNAMRYHNGTTWNGDATTGFEPIVSGTATTEVLTTTLAFGSASYGPQALGTFPIIEGTLKVTVSLTGQTDVIFRDTPKDGTLVSSGSNTGTIVYSTGTITLNFDPVLPGAGNWTVTAEYDVPDQKLIQARILIPYYGRLLALNTIEGDDLGDAGNTNIYNRCRFSQIGDPTQQDAWRSDVFGKGGFIDAPTNEEIISAEFFKKTLIVQFEKSTWRLQYLGEYGLPFIWERISSDFGGESTFSTVLFDDGVLAVGDKAIVSCNGNSVDRIDLEIPDQVYEFKNTDNGVKRVHGVRDFKKELVYWCYPDFDLQQQNQYYPCYSLVYNYRNNTWAKFRNSVTCFGPFQYPASVTWDSLDIFWDSKVVTWDGASQENLPLIASGNQQGFAHYYGYADVETAVDSTIDTNDQESLSITGVTVGSTVDLTIVNHNLVSGEFLYITGLKYLVTASSTVGSTTLNDFIYKILFLDVDTVSLAKWDQTANDFVTDFTVTNVGTYIGGGVAALLPRLNVETKDFNPVKQMGQNIKLSYIDFLFDTTTNSEIAVNLLMNTVTKQPLDKSQANLLIGNTSIEKSNRKFGTITNISLDNPCVITSKDHGLLDNDVIKIESVSGTTEVNNLNFTVTFISLDTFSIGVDSSAYTAYESGGNWYQVHQQYYTLNSEYAWHRFFATCFGQFLKLQLTNSDEQMAQITTHQQLFALNAMQIYYRPGGKNIFGK